MQNYQGTAVNPPIQLHDTVRETQITQQLGLQEKVIAELRETIGVLCARVQSVCMPPNEIQAPNESKQEIFAPLADRLRNNNLALIEATNIIADTLRRIEL